MDVAPELLDALAVHDTPTIANAIQSPEFGPAELAARRARH